MTDVISRIKDLQEKKQKAQTASTRLSTQLETLAEDKQKLEDKLENDFGITFEEAEAKMEELQAEQKRLLEQAEEKLSRINL